MAIVDILKQLDLESLSAVQKTALTKRLQTYRRDLEKALAAVEAGLAQLTPQPAPRKRRSGRGTRRKSS
jgi:hypothetical protein